MAVLLHGIGGNSGQWAEVAQGISPFLTSIIWDARGYGASEGPEIRSFSEFSDDLAAVIDAFGGGPVLGVGHSMGGRILIETALESPDLFSGLLLSGTQSSYLTHLPAAEKLGYVERRLAMFEEGRVQPEKALAVAREVLPSGSPGTLIQRLASDFERLRPEGYGAAIRASAGWDRRADLHRLRPPVEIVGGALDPICPVAEVYAMAEAVGSPHLNVLEHVAHMMPLEAPDAMVSLLLGFAERHGHKARDATSAHVPAQ